MAAATPAEAPAAAAPKKSALLIPIIAAALLSAALSGAAVFFLAPKPAAAPAHEQAAEAAAEAHGEAAAEGHDAGDKDGKKGTANYLPLTPAFVVNVHDGNDGDASHFLQVEIELSARSAAVVDALKLHNAQIRNALLMLLGAQSSADVASREGKEALQKKVLEEVQRILIQETGKPGVDAVYFTSFVMQ
ncbi:flagellar basal body-associated FliL family protein [Nevskia sp.]|uniref:flagellar basal body-associated FliL family protein n=1 Tax=Nevskia sp. TaxID=1929292 RepID=UPI0025F0DCBC|nr:flagellar basal body-associated FliL family protein [Nevskia sp.]